MNNAPAHIQELARKWISGTITPEEMGEFMNWYNNADDGQPLDIPKEFATDDLSHSIRMYRNIIEKNYLSDQSEKNAAKTIHRIQFLRNSWFRYAAAIIIILGVAAYFITRDTSMKREVVKVSPAPVKTEITAPVSSHAIITLGNGRKINLDTALNGTITTIGKIQVVKLADGHFAYKGTASEISYNTLTNPRGSKVVNIVLTDGTKVWLNSESSIRYPATFTGNERVVEITGETYFEVARNEAMPFRVKKDGMIVTVLGTHFNVNTYEEEGDMKVTLLEGSVQVSSAKIQSSIHLEPGQQSQLNNNGKLTVSKNVNTDDIVAWKDGKFQFGEKSDIGTIMRMLARWYDVDVEYEGTINRHFGGSISSDVNLSRVLKVLETTGDVSFKVEGKKVTVKSDRTKYKEG